MSFLRFLLFPIGVIYFFITATRNALYNSNVFKSFAIPKKSIIVGNLSMGGTGKSPHTDYLISHLKKSQKVSTLSRGYGRKSKGFLEVLADSNVKNVGDEPLMYKTKHRDDIGVYVAEKRKDGVLGILEDRTENDVILLDDAFQHRKVSAGLNILITEYERPYSRDHIFPVGNLREPRSGAARADIIVVSKCPQLDQQEKERIIKELKPSNDQVFFSQITYGPLRGFKDQEISDVKNILLVTGIGNPTPLVKHLEKDYNVFHMNYRDHHDFSSKDIAEIHQKFDTFASQEKIILTTEKDFMRIKDLKEIISHENEWYYQPITVQIDNEEKFNLLIDNYVSKV